MIVRRWVDVESPALSEEQMETLAEGYTVPLQPMIPEGGKFTVTRGGEEFTVICTWSINGTSYIRRATADEVGKVPSSV